MALKRITSAFAGSCSRLGGPRYLRSPSLTGSTPRAPVVLSTFVGGGLRLAMDVPLSECVLSRVASLPEADAPVRPYAVWWFLRARDGALLLFCDDGRRRPLTLSYAV